MSIDTVDGALGALGLTLKNAAAGAVASFVSLRFFDGLTPWQKWTTFFGGWAMAAWGGPPLREYLELKPAVEIAFVLLLGFFGMAVAAEVMKILRDTDWKGLLLSVLKRNGGSK